MVFSLHFQLNSIKPILFHFVHNTMMDQLLLKIIIIWSTLYYKYIRLHAVSHTWKLVGKNANMSACKLGVVQALEDRPCYLQLHRTFQFHTLTTDHFCWDFQANERLLTVYSNMWYALLMQLNYFSLLHFNIFVQ